MVFRYPRVYPILDASIIPLTGRPQFLSKLGNALTKAGVTPARIPEQDQFNDVIL